jgi:drug/metabolite transporter (DMT)-like permease
MKHLIILAVLFMSATAFSQTTTDSIFTQKPTKSIVIQKVDTVQIARINDIETRLSAFYTYNRRSHSLLFLSVGMSLAGIIMASNSNSNSNTAIIPLAGSIVGLVGTIIYLDSYKFLNFKPKRKEIRDMTYY